MRIDKYGTSKCMIENRDNTYTFLNVTMWEAFKFWVSAKLKNSMGGINATKTGDRSKDLD